MMIPNSSGAVTDQSSSTGNDSTTVDTLPTVQPPMQLLKHSLHQCKHRCITKNNLSLLPDDKCCCSVKAHHSSVLKASANPVNEKTRCDADSLKGPDTEPNLMSLLLGWWTTEGIYSKYRVGKDQTGNTKEANWQMLSQLIK